MCYGLCQAEITVYIVAQTIPLLRVLSFKKKKNSNTSRHDTRITSVAEIGKGKAQATVVSELRQPSIELVQLASGKIVAADSEEGKQFQASQPTGKQPAGVVQSAGSTTQVSPETKNHVPAAAPERNSVNSVEDEVHRLWADMYAQSLHPTFHRAFVFLAFSFERQD